MSSSIQDVVILGAGPTGLSLAAELVRLGVQPMILDRLAAGANTSRAAVVHARTLEVLEPLGVVPELIENGLRIGTFRVRDRDRVLISLSFAGLETKYPFALMCPQNRTEAILLNRLEALGGAVERPCEAISVQDAGEHVSVVYREGDSEQTVQARWVVGCDGSHSLVREQAAISFEGAAYEEAFVLADVEMEWPLGRDEGTILLSEKGIVVVVPLPGNHFRIVATVDAAPPLPAAEDFERILAERGPTGSPVTIQRMAWSSRFHISHRVAGTLRKGRILLCGDAAHVHSPAGGQGMNTGIQDAVSLAGALHTVLHDGGTEALDQWQERRLEIARSVVSTTDRITRMATVSSPAARALRNVIFGLVGHIPAMQHALAKNLAELDNR